MNISEFLSHESLRLPKQRDDDDFGQFIRGLFDGYLQVVAGLAGIDWPTRELKRNHQVLEDLCNRICAALNQYLDGFPARAYDSMSKALQEVLAWLGKLGTTTDVSSHLKYLYRIRLGSLVDYRRPDLFHIPFEKRHIVSPQRYSILGLPSLYLGGSVWICWEEMGRPAFEQIQVARFKAVPASDLRVLDFAYRPAVMARLANRLHSYLDEKTDNAEFVLSHAACWPLLAACSIRVRYPENPFVPEYVVPQLLLQWIRDQDYFEGIRYFSTRIPQLEEGDADEIQASVDAASNYVFPAVIRAPTGQCERLSSQFKLTTPMAWPIIQNVDLSIADPVRDPPKWSLRLHEDSKALYRNTSFYNCERKINGLPCRSVSEG